VTGKHPQLQALRFAQARILANGFRLSLGSATYSVPMNSSGPAKKPLRARAGCV